MLVQNGIKKCLTMSIVLMMNLFVLDSNAEDIRTSTPNYLIPPNPVYSIISKRAEEEGIVMVRVIININGEVEGVGLHKSSGFTRLDDSALAAVAKAKFKPYQSIQSKLQEAFIVPVKFELEPLSAENKK
jgi:protein TonB